MRHLDLFSGIGGFSLGLKMAGFKFEKTYYSDIDKYANMVYAWNFPEAIALGDWRTFFLERDEMQSLFASLPAKGAAALRDRVLLLFQRGVARELCLVLRGASLVRRRLALGFR